MTRKSNAHIIQFSAYITTAAGLNRHIPVGRQMENNDGEKRDSDAWNDEVDSVEQRLSPDCDVESKVWVWFRATGIVFFMLACWNGQQIPLNATVEVF